PRPHRTARRPSTASGASSSRVTSLGARRKRSASPSTGSGSNDERGSPLTHPVPAERAPDRHRAALRFPRLFLRLFPTALFLGHFLGPWALSLGPCPWGPVLGALSLGPCPWGPDLGALSLGPLPPALSGAASPAGLRGVRLPADGSLGQLMGPTHGTSS